MAIRDLERSRIRIFRRHGVPDLDPVVSLPGTSPARGEFALWLREIIDKNDLTQMKIATASGLDQTTVSRALKGAKSKTKTMEAIRGGLKKLGIGGL